MKEKTDERTAVVGLLLRDDETKCVSDAIEALATVRNRMNLIVLAAGSWSKPTPSWVVKVDTKTDRQLSDFYNKISIFLLSSEYEGWGLPAMEAMACGAAIVSSRNGGVEDFLVNEKNALLCEPRNSGEMAVAVERLIGDEAFRRYLVRNGLEAAREFTWTPSVNKLERFLIDNLSRC